MKSLKRYLITIAVGLVATGLMAWSRGILSQTATVNIFHILCDSFFVVGMVITCVGTLIFVSNEGTFDIIVYGLKSFWGMFKKNYIKKYDTFYDYKVSRQDKKFSFSFLLISGIIFIIISVIMYMLYCNYI